MLHNKFEWVFSIEIESGLKNVLLFHFDKSKECLDLKIRNVPTHKNVYILCLVVPLYIAKIRKIIYKTYKKQPTKRHHLQQMCD